MGQDDELIPMSALPFAEEELRRLLSRWLPPVQGPSGEQLERIARTAAQQYLREEEEGEQKT
jgi:hypothetical protein